MGAPKGRIPWNKGGDAKSNPIIAQIAEKQKGRKHTDETKERMRKAKENYVPWNTGETKETNEIIAQQSEKMKGREFSDEHKFNLSLAKKGKSTWNKGRDDLPKGVFHHSEETKQLLREKNMGENNPMWGKKQTEEHIEKRITPLIGIPRPQDVIDKIRDGNLGQIRSEETRKNISDAKMGSIPWNKGIPMSEEQKQLYSKLFTGKKDSEETKKKKSEFWTNYYKEIGYSKEDWYQDFGDHKHEEVRKRDGYKCMMCGRSREEAIEIFGDDLHVHHIDHIKPNSFVRNLISYCLSCHAKTNHGILIDWYRREYNILKKIYGYNYAEDNIENNTLKKKEDVKKVLEEIENGI